MLHSTTLKAQRLRSSVRKTHIFRAILYCKGSFRVYQGRPWTNIGKAALKKRGRVAFFAALIVLRAKVRKRHPFLCRYAVLNTEHIYQDGLGTNKHRGKFRNQTFPAHKGRPSLCRQAPKARPEALRRRSKAARQAGTADRRGGAGAKTNKIVLCVSID
eukprot:COSAG06_NODE_2438_length_6875_cov_7.162633_2_plen_159_part_00